jgi:hypothetical protein
VPVDATVVRRQLRLRDILHMQPGDVIPVEMPEHMIMRANGVPSFKVKLGSHKGNLAFQILEPLERRAERSYIEDRFTMADEENVTPEEQALADEWAAALSRRRCQPGRYRRPGRQCRPAAPVAPRAPWKSSAGAQGADHRQPEGRTWT